ncbi:hypothetical protein [Bulleidia extructa]|uniref:hypothetical protein n=1 Tax=Bulleidia extructa TaxID=118748 RepID=UPI003BF2E26E
MRKGKVFVALMMLLVGCSKPIVQKKEPPKKPLNSHFQVVKHYETKSVAGDSANFHYLERNKLYTSMERYDQEILLQYRSKSLGYIDITNGKYTSIYHFKDRVRCWDFFVQGKGFYYSEFEEDGEIVTVGYQENGQRKKIDEGVVVNPWALPMFNKVEGNRLLYQIITRENGRHFHQLKTINLDYPNDVKTLYKEEVKPEINSNYRYSVNQNRVTFNKREGKKGWYLSLDLKTGKVTDVTGVIEDPIISDALYLGNNQYLLENIDGHSSVVYDIEKKKEILSFGGNRSLWVGIGDRQFFSTTDVLTDGSLAKRGELVELKDGKIRTVEVKGYKKVGDEFERMFYSNGKLVIADQKLVHFDDKDRRNTVIINVVEEKNEENEKNH